MNFTNSLWPIFLIMLLSSTLTLAKIWAVLVSGGRGIKLVDYASQASVYHAWHILRDHGVNPEQIILMAYDDIANDRDNPHPGKVFNDPKGIDVYKGVKIDYRRKDVNVANFMAVLQGEAEKTGGKPVLNSTEEDNVFVYFVDHGSNGFISFPDEILTVNDLKMTLTNMNAKGMYKKMVFYLEACYSGSMFESWAHELEQMNIYAVTSSNSTAPSWGIYCDLDITKERGIACKKCHELAPKACLGSDFSRSWMLNVDFLSDLQVQTMGRETEFMKMGTMFSSVCEFGDMSIRSEKISAFMGNESSSWFSNKHSAAISRQLDYPAAVSLIDANEMLIKTEIMRGDKAAINELESLHMRRQYFDEQIALLVDRVLASTTTTPKAAAAGLALAHRQRRVLTLDEGRIHRMECHHQVMHAFNKKCFNLAKNPYAMTKAFILNNLCELGIRVERIVSAFDELCANLKITKGIE